MVVTAADKPVVFTCVTAEYDRVNAIPSTTVAGCRCVAFLDGGNSRPDWEYQPAPAFSADPCRNAKLPKIMPHLFFPNTEYSIWVDGSVEITCEIPLVSILPELLQDCDLAVFSHRTRQCAYDEARTCVRLRKDNIEIITRQMAEYRRAGFPARYGLAECPVLIRRHTPAMKTFNETWWEQILAHSRRDQLSFNYVAWRLNFPFRRIGGTIDKNPYFRRHRHRKPITNTAGAS